MSTLILMKGLSVEYRHVLVKTQMLMLITTWEKKLVIAL